MLTKKYRFKFYLNARHSMKMDNADNKVHPHTWEIVLFVENKSGKFIPFTNIEKDIGLYLSMYEGQLVNEIPPFNMMEPSLENIGTVVYEQVSRILESIGWAMVKLEISENPSRTYIVEDIKKKTKSR